MEIGTWDGKTPPSLDSKCPMCLNEEKSEVTKRNYNTKLQLTCTRCTFEWQAVVPAELKRHFSERKKMSQSRKHRIPELPTLPPKLQEKKDEEDDRSNSKNSRVPKRVYPNVLDRGEDDSYEGSSSDTSMMLVDEDTVRRTGKSEKAKRRKSRLKKKQFQNSRNLSKSAHNLHKDHNLYNDHRSHSVPKSNDIATVVRSKSQMHLLQPNTHSQSSQSGSYERKEPKYADCLVKSVICDGNMVVLMGACTNCKTANEVDVAIMDAKNIMEVECYQCGISYQMEPPSENLLKAIGKS